MSTCFVRLKIFVIKLLKIKQILFANVFKKLLLLVISDEKSVRTLMVVDEKICEGLSDKVLIKVWRYAKIKEAMM